MLEKKKIKTNAYALIKQNRTLKNQIKKFVDFGVFYLTEHNFLLYFFFFMYLFK